MINKKTLRNIVISAVALGSVLLSSCKFTREGRLENQIIRKEYIKTNLQNIGNIVGSRSNFKTSVEGKTYGMQYFYFPKDIYGRPERGHELATTVAHNGILIEYIRGKNKIGLDGGLVDSKIGVFKSNPTIYGGWRAVAERISYSQLDPCIQQAVKKEYELFLKSDFLEKLTHSNDSIEQKIKEENEQWKMQRETQQKEKAKKRKEKINRKFRDYLIKK